MPRNLAAVSLVVFGSLLIGIAGYAYFEHLDAFLNSTMLLGGMAVSASSRLLTLQRASAESGIPATTLRDLHFRGHLPICRFPENRRWWVRREDLERLIERSIERGELRDTTARRTNGGLNPARGQRRPERDRDDHRDDHRLEAAH